MTKEQWDAWFAKFKKELKKWEKEKLDSSIELKLAVQQKDFSAAESIAIQILGGKNKGEQKVNRILNDFLE